MNLHAQAVEYIGLNIVSGRFATGQVLPTEVELGKRLGVSRTVLREAIKTIAAKGMIESRARVGTRVRERCFWNHLDVEVLRWQFETMSRKDFFQSLFEIRRAIEPSAAALAAQKATRADLDAIEKALERMEAAESSEQEAIDADIAFHHALFRACDNPMLLQVGELIAIGLLNSFRISDESYSASLPFHRPVFEAVRKHDPHGARTAMESLLQDTLKFIDANMQFGEKQRRPASKLPSQARGRSRG